MKLLSYAALLTLLACNNPATFTAGSNPFGSTKSEDAIGEETKPGTDGTDKSDSDNNPDGSKTPRVDDPNTPEDESKLDEDGNPLNPDDEATVPGGSDPGSEQPGGTDNDPGTQPGGSTNQPTPEECEKDPSLCGDYDPPVTPPVNHGGGHQNQNQNQ